jgi:hypothetical protein
VREKIRLLKDMDAVLEDTEVLALLSSKPSGERIVSIFKEALEKEIKNIFNDKVEEIIDPVNQLLDRIKEATEQFTSKSIVTSANVSVVAPAAVSKPLNIPLANPVSEVTENQQPTFREPPAERRLGNRPVLFD